MINGCVLTDILYSYILDKHIGMTNIKKKSYVTRTLTGLLTIDFLLHVSALFGPLSRSFKSLKREVSLDTTQHISTN